MALLSPRPRPPALLVAWTLALAAPLASPGARSPDLPAPVDDDSPVFSAPPNPPVITCPTDDAPSTLRLAGPAPVQYSIGEPTDEEQWYVELINRARANPPAEGARLAADTTPAVLKAYAFYKVDLALLRSQFDAIAPAAPLSIQPLLTDAARVHSQDMFVHTYQGHVEADGADLATQLKRTGYPFANASQNVYSYAEGVWHGHAGFEVDWGDGPGGMQSPPGHRVAIHNPSFREIGVGVVLGKNGSVGPQLCTQDFGVAQGSAKPFVTGVVFYDLNGNQFYDLGEGLGGVRVTVSGVSTFALTSRSGGYSVPVTSNGTYTVTFEVPGLAPVTQNATVANLANVKVDLSPLYFPPTLGGATVAAIGQPNPYVFTPVGGATGYQWRTLKRETWDATEGAETGLGRLTADVSTNYPVLAKDVRYSGTASFHLAHPQPVRNQFLAVGKPLRLGAAPGLSFYSRLGWSGPGESGRVQISNDDGANWKDLWKQTGTGNAGEALFSARTISLAEYAGQTVLLRFAYIFESGTYFPQTSTGVGLYLDDIQLTDAEVLADEVVQSAAGGGFSFEPSVVGLYQLQVRALIGDRILPWGPALNVDGKEGASPEQPQVSLSALEPRADGSVGFELVFVLERGTASTFEIESASDPAGPWSAEGSAAPVASTGPGVYRTRLDPQGAEARFYRVRAK